MLAFVRRISGQRVVAMAASPTIILTITIIIVSTNAHKVVTKVIETITAIVPVPVAAPATILSLMVAVVVALTTITY